MDNQDRLKELKDEDGIIIIYRRLSKENTRGVSLEMQEKSAREWLKFNNLHDNQEILVLTDVESGKNDERGDFLKMKQLLPKTKLIVSFDVTRLARRMITTLEFDEARKKAGTEIYFMTQSVGSWQGTHYNLLISIFGALAQNELETISYRQRATKEGMRKNGRGAFTGGHRPYGLISKKIKEENSEGKTMNVPYLFNVKEELEIVKKIYHKYSEIRSIDKLCEWCTQNNFKDNKKGDKKRKYNIFRRSQYKWIYIETIRY